MDNTFRTDDISVASYLLAKGSKLLEITSDRPRHSIFVFENHDNCQFLKQEFINNGQVTARELLARRAELVSEMKDADGGRYGKP